MLINDIYPLIEEKEYEKDYIEIIKLYYRETDKFIKRYKTNKKLPLFKSQYLSGRTTTLQIIKNEKKKT